VKRKYPRVTESVWGISSSSQVVIQTVEGVPAVQWPRGPPGTGERWESFPAAKHC